MSPSELANTATLKRAPGHVMWSASIRRLHLVSWLGFTFVMTGCQEGACSPETGDVTKFLVDWVSDANHLTITLYKTGESPAPGAPVVAANCRVPGSPVAAPPSLPVCPVIVSVTTHEKPKAVQSSPDIGNFSIVVTNHGPGNEIIRWFAQGIGRRTRICSLANRPDQTAESHLLDSSALVTAACLVSGVPV